MVDEFDEENIIGIRLAYDISELPVKDITNPIDVSGIDNPIPVAKGYAFQTIDKTQATSLASSGSEEVTFTPAAGNVYLLKDMYLSTVAPSGGGSGSHSFIIYSGNVNTGLELISNYDASLSYKNSRLIADQLTSLDAGDIAHILRQMYATETSPLTVRYENNTDVAQDFDRNIVLKVQEVQAPPS